MSIQRWGMLVASGMLALAAMSAQAQEPEAIQERSQTRDRERIHQTDPSETGMPRGSGQQTRSTYKVRRGDTLSEIARQHGVSVRELARQNGIENSNRIRVGQELTIPAREQMQQRERTQEQVREHQPDAPGMRGQKKGGPGGAMGGSGRGGGPRQR